MAGMKLHRKESSGTQLRRLMLAQELPGSRLRCQHIEWMWMRSGWELMARMA